MAVGQEPPCPPSYAGKLDFDFSPFLQGLTPEVDCLGGPARLLAALTLAGARFIRTQCDAGEGTALGDLCQQAQEMIDSHSWLKSTLGYLWLSVGRVAREGACLITALTNGFASAVMGGRSETEGDVEVFTAATLLHVLLGIWERWGGKLPAWMAASLEELQQFFFPRELPTGPEANALYASGLISKEDWTCLIRARGLVPRWQRRSVRMLQGRPSAHELLLLQRLYTSQLRDEQNKGEAANPDKIAELEKKLEDVATLFKRDGFTDSTYLKYWLEGQRWFPSPTDAIEWMLKDTEDPQIQKTFALGAEFTQKYTGAVRDAFDWNGITPELADRIWRAHWRNMSPHILYEMHKRLRPGWTNLLSDEDVALYVTAIAPTKSAQVTQQVLEQRPQVVGPTFEDLTAAGVPAAVAQPASQPWRVPTYRDELVDPLTQRAWLESLSTTAYQVSEALGQADYAPFWRQRLMAVSYSPLTRVDLRRAYETDNITFERLVAGLQDRGYAPADAQSLADFYYSAAVQTMARRPIVNQWVKTGFDIKLLQKSLSLSGGRKDLIDDVLEIADVRRKIAVQQECLESIKRGFISHFLEEQETRYRLAKLGFSGPEQDKFVEDWTCIRDSKSKVESASDVCTAFKVGLITAKEAVKSLRQLGYTQTQARRILAICGIRELPKTLKPQLLPQVLRQLALGGA